MMSRCLHLVLGALLAVTVSFAAASPAAAQGGGDDDAKATMLKLSDEARALFEKGDFAQAAETYRKAYEAYQDPVLLKNQMVAFYKADDCDSAIGPGTAFLKVGAADATDRRDVMTVLVNCEVQVAARNLKSDNLDEAELALKRAESFAPSPDQTKAIETVRERIVARRKEMAAKTETPDDTIEGPPPPGPPILAYSLLGAGGASLVAGLIFYSLASSARSDVEYFACANPTGRDASCPDDFDGGRPDNITNQAELDDRRSSFETNRAVAYGLLSVGIVSAAVGAVLLITHDGGEKAPDAKPDPKDEDEETPVGRGTLSVFPVVGPDVTGAQLEWRF